MSFDFDRALLDTFLRDDLSKFIHRSFQTVSPGQTFEGNWHIDAMAWALQQCFEGKIRRLIITVPPRHLKSICASVAFPAWALGRNPALRFMCVSHSSELASVHSRDCRRVMEADWFQNLFPHSRLGEKNTEMEFATESQGCRFATSVGGTLTGRGGEIIILDDVLKADDGISNAKRSSVNEWFGRSLYSRLDDKRSGVIIVIMQRLHMEDLVGYLLQQDNWVHLNLPVISDMEEQ